MRLRQLVLACGLSSLMLSQYASALGLGEVTLKSSLNQPLQAEIKLLDTRDLSAEQILVTLASPADFERNGVERLYFYTEFQFEVDLNAADGPKVIVTSRNPVREPYINFLVEARWTAGRLLREYTLLMDLPTFADDAAPAGVNSATTGRTTGTRPQATAPSQTSSTRPRPSSSVAAPSVSGDEYRVKANDTLWEIARSASQGTGASIHQAMIALYEANPDAFINGNINLLRRGQVLRIPSADTMTSVSRSDAVAQFSQRSNDTDLGAQLNASRRTVQSDTGPSEVSGRVKLAAPSAAGGRSGQGSGANEGSGAGLETELAATLEELDKSKAENSELSSRVRDLEEQIKTMERLVEVSNEKLRTMQLTAQQQAASSVAAEAQASADQRSLGVSSFSYSDSSTAEIPAVVPAAPESSAAASSAASKASSAAASSKPRLITPPPQPSLTDKLIDNAPWIGLGLVIIGAGVYLVYRRRKQEQEEEALAAESDVFAMDNSLAEEEEQLFVENEEDLVPVDEPEFDLEPEPAEVEDDVSALDKADIHIAYGQLDKAEELLLQGLKKDPDSVDMRLKLLEVYSQKQDVQEFDKHYALLLPLAGAMGLARASELRDAIPGAGAFSGTVSASDEDNAPADEFNFDDLQLDDEEPQPAAESVELADNDLDFDLELDDISDVDRGDTAGDQPLDGANAFADFDLTLDEEEPVTDADDLSELSLALDELEDEDQVAADLNTAGLTVDDEFNFDLDAHDDLSADTAAPESENLDVAADDFNLDMDVGDVDLAALDHEMEALDQIDEETEALDLSETDLSDTDAVTSLEGLEGLEEENEELDFDSIEPTETRFDLGELDEDLADLDSLSLDEVSSEGPAGVDEPALIDDDEFAIDLEEAQDLELDDQIPALDEPLPATENLEPELADVREEDVFEEALSGFDQPSADIQEADLDLDSLAEQNFDMSDEDMDAELDFLADADEAATKLDLARAYMDMGDADGARDILSEVMSEGNDQQRGEAQELLNRIDA